MGNLFDLDSDLIKEANSSIQDELDKAYILCMREQYDKALKIYNNILDQDMKNEQAYIGLLRVHSECFTIFKGDKIEQDLRIIKRLFPNSKDQEYLDYLKAKEGNEKPKAEPKSAPKAEPKATHRTESKVESKSAPILNTNSGSKNSSSSKYILPEVEKYYESLLGLPSFIEDNWDKYSEYTSKARKLANSNRSEAILNYSEALKYTDGKGCRREIFYRMAELYEAEARTSFNNNYIDLALGCYFKALKCVTKSNENYGIIANSIGFIFSNKKNDYATASYYYNAGVKSWYYNAYGLALCYKKAGDYTSYGQCLAYYINNSKQYEYEINQFKEALYQLGMLLMEGKGINKDLKEAKNVFTHLSNLGDSRGDEMLRKL